MNERRNVPGTVAARWKREEKRAWTVEAQWKREEQHSCTVEEGREACQDNSRKVWKREEKRAWTIAGKCGRGKRNVPGQ